jgi:hypothetical protein
MGDRRGVARASIRAAGGVAGIAVAALLIAGASVLPVPSFSIAAPVSRVTPVPADQQRVCPGPLLALAADASAATSASSVGAPSLSYATDGPAVQTRLLKPDSDAGGRSEAPQALTVSTPAGSTTPPLISAAQTQDAETPDLAGLATAACAEPSGDSWLVAGSTALGQTSLVLLSNPTSVQATVDLTVFAETGPVDAPGAAGIVVPAGAQKVIPLAGLAPSVSAPVVHVQATGGQVLASLQQSFEQGIDPRGVELTGTTGSPSRVQVISGMTVASLAKLQASQSGEGYGADLPAVRVFVPGTQDAEITVGAVGENGTAAGNSYAQTIKAGTVGEIPLDHLKDGYYTVTVRSSVPVVAAARTSVVGSKTRDFSWFVSSRPMTDAFLVAVPPAPSPVLHLANPGTTDQKVVIAGRSGAPLTVTVPAEGATHVGLAVTDYTVTGAQGLYAGVSVAGDGLASSYALNPAGPQAAPVDVYAR